jgi:hypothetical protein
VNTTSIAINVTGTDPQDYTTSQVLLIDCTINRPTGLHYLAGTIIYCTDYTTPQIGNASIAFMAHVIESGLEHPPFFVYLGPHAPHKPSIPAPWYADNPIGDLPLTKVLYYTLLCSYCTIH